MKDIHMTAYELGKVAYDAYCNTTQWKSATSGAPLPEFRNTSTVIQDAWIAAALAVMRKLKQEGAPIHEPGIIRELRDEDLFDT